MSVFVDKRRSQQAGRTVWRYDFRWQGQNYVDACRDPVSGDYCSSLSAARRVEEAAKVAVRNRPGVPVKAPTGYAIAQMFEDYLATIEDTANYQNAIGYVAELLSRAEFAPDKDVNDITDRNLETYIAWAKDQPLMVWIGGPDRARAAKTAPGRLWKPHPSGARRSATTINKYLSTLSSAMRRAHKLRDPVTRERLLKDTLDIPYLKEPQRPARPIPDIVLARLIAHCGRSTNYDPQAYQYRKHLAHALLIARQMPFRKDEIFQMTVHGIDEENRGYWLEAAGTKGFRGEFLPAPPQAMKLLLWLQRRAIRLGQERLILYRTRDGRYTPIAEARSAWESVRRELRLPYSFHNTKASYSTKISRVASQETTQSLSRHKDYKTTKRYLLVGDQDRRDAADRIGYTAPGAALRAAREAARKLAPVPADRSPQTPTPESDTPAFRPAIRRVK